jgi:hypothetical protein
MVTMTRAPNVPGADAIVQWWGDWIDFHDFHMYNLPQVGQAEADLVIHGWVTDTDRQDAQGCWLQHGHCTVTLEVRGVRRVELSPPVSDAAAVIIMALTIEPQNGGWLISWTSSYGPCGDIEADRVAVSLAPGEPTTQNG